jgi:hypothetical protein
MKDGYPDSVDHGLSVQIATSIYSTLLLDRVSLMTSRHVWRIFAKVRVCYENDDSRWIRSPRWFIIRSFENVVHE